MAQLIEVSSQFSKNMFIFGIVLIPQQFGKKYTSEIYYIISGIHGQ